MKKYLASFTAALLMLGVIPVSAQNQAPPPPDDSSSPYGQYDSPYGQQSDPRYNSPYGQQSGPQYDPRYGQQSRPQAGPPPDQQGGQDQDQADANGPGVARISVINGDVSMQHGDNGDWVAVTVNTPVSTDDRVSTASNARAELQLDYANILRMSGSATAKIASISRQGIQVQIGQGLVTYIVLKGAEANPEIDTPNATIHPQGEGEFRILVNSDAETQVIVRRGSADISTPQGSEHVDQGQMITVAGTDQPQYKTDSAPGRDEWDLWNTDRDHTLSATSTLGKTDPYYTGAGDLDTYGTWSEVPDYGRVWTPSSPGPDWAPYRDGRWVYQPYYGWTWVSYEPWGWAPYHYGRWFVYGGSWVWWPGPVGIGIYPVWAPAYVSFFGFGGGFGFGVGFGRFGWLPCGPGDWYHPWYGRYGARFNSVAVGNFHGGFAPIGGGRREFSNINAALRNDRVRSGISSMGGNEFGRGAVSTHQARISEASFRQASVMTGRMPVSPSRESFSPTGRVANPASFRNAPSNSQHFSTGGSRGQSVSGGNRNPGSFERPSQITNSGRENSSSAQSSRPRWHTFSSPQSSGGNRSSQAAAASNRPASVQSENRSSWQHFTPPSSASRGTSSNSYSRTPLNMRQPIVTQRGESRSYGSSQSSPYNAPRGAYSAPSGSYSAPRGSYSAPRGSYSAPRSYSAPSGSALRGGGGYSSPRPSYSAPRSSGSSGGSSHSSGGGGGGGRSGGGGSSGGGHSHR